jgi:hypothetical protein
MTACGAAAAAKKSSKNRVRTPTHWALNAAALVRSELATAAARLGSLAASTKPAANSSLASGGSSAASRARAAQTANAVNPTLVTMSQVSPALRAITASHGFRSHS